MTQTLTKSRKSSPRGKLKGNQTPTRIVVPEYEDTEWQDCHAVNAAGGLELFEWQDNIMRGWLGRNKVGRWSALTCAGSVPRQNGKTLGLVVPRINYGMLLLGEEVIYTSHLQKTSTETFEAMVGFFEHKAVTKYVKDIKTALGREQIILKNGARCKFLARTRNGGRGQHGDLLIFDEALELDAEQQASFLPAISASDNPQTIYVSSPPTGQADGNVFRTIRERALTGAGERTAWFEWSVDEIGNVRDRERWYATNPSMGILIDEATVEGEVEQMDTDTFARERLGWWTPIRQAEYVITDDEWNALTNERPTRDGTLCYAVKFSPDGSTGSISACYKNETPFVYVVDSKSTSHGIGWFADEIAKRHKKAAQIVIDGQSNAQDLNDRLIAAGVPAKVIIRPKTGDVIAACSSFANAVKEGTIEHYGQDALTISATRSTRRKIGNNGGWGFSSNEEADATLVESAALAYWAAMTTKRKPGRKAVIL